MSLVIFKCISNWIREYRNLENKNRDSILLRSFSVIPIHPGYFFEANEKEAEDDIEDEQGNELEDMKK